MVELTKIKNLHNKIHVSCFRFLAAKIKEMEKKQLNTSYEIEKYCTMSQKKKKLKNSILFPLYVTIIMWNLMVCNTMVCIFVFVVLLK